MLAAVAEGELDDPLLVFIALMLTRDTSLDYYLALKPVRIGAPKKPGLLWRDYFLALSYEKACKDLGSDAAFEATAESFRISVSAVRKAVTWHNKLKASTAKRKASH